MVGPIRLVWSSGVAAVSRQAATRRILTSARLLQEPQRELEEMTVSDNHHHHRGASPITSKLRFLEPSQEAPVATLRLLNPDGTLAEERNCEPHASLTPQRLVGIYRQMLQLNVLDKIMFDSQRQGRISFYMTNFGEEATQFGSAAALEARDWVFAQYREAGVLLYREMPLRLMLAQCYGNKEDLGKGRQMPIHYGNRGLNFVTLSSPLTTQLPQAAGAAYSFKTTCSGPNDRVVICYFGEGAASEGDAHAAMNFAATLKCPMIFFCRNNGYAISTPTHEQFASDGIVTRGLGYGMAAIRVDGNDLLAVHEATRRARRICLEESRPCLIEAMTYRVGHHSTSDDSSAYRRVEEVRLWERHDSPIQRLQNYLRLAGLWTDEQQQDSLKEARANVLEALNWAERVKKLPIGSMFEDVYDQLPANLVRQRQELLAHLSKYGEHYKLDEFEREP